MRQASRTVVILSALFTVAGCTSLFNIQDGVLGGSDAGLDATALADGQGAETGPATEGGADSSGADATVSDATGAEGAVPEGGGADAPPDGASDGGVADAVVPADGGPILGGTCSAPGATACNGHDSQVVLICQNGTWGTFGNPCPATQRCDSAVGSCADVAAGCSGLQPGQTFCLGGNVVQCGPDLVTTSVVTQCGPHQSCTGGGGSVQCTCNADPQCSVAGPTCAGDAGIDTCAVDTQSCMYTADAGACTNGPCYGSAGSAQCCQQTCSVAGDSCNAPHTAILTCKADSNGCLQLQAPYDCATNNAGAVCVVGSYVHCGCNTAADCAGSSYGTACVANFCGCNTSAQCTNGACCDPAHTTCYPNGEMIGGLGTCTNGVWK
jgi:hypothetical protein